MTDKPTTDKVLSYQTYRLVTRRADGTTGMIADYSDHESARLAALALGLRHAEIQHLETIYYGSTTVPETWEGSRP